MTLVLFNAVVVPAIVFEVGIRSWVFARTSSNIDVELAARLFRHPLGLPLSYFPARRVGVSVARVRELENIRSFLTGNAMTRVIDLVFAWSSWWAQLCGLPLLKAA